MLKKLKQRIPLLLVTAVTMASVAGCTGGDQSAHPSNAPSASAPATSSSPDSTATAPATTLAQRDAVFEVTIQQLRGGVPGASRARLRHRISKPIEAWVQAGFLDGPYPRTGFGAAFDPWTSQAAALGRRHRNVTTNAMLGRRLVEVWAERQRVRLFIFASNGKTGGATGEVYLRLTGRLRHGALTTYTVSGELYLTRRDNTWRIFGYTLHRTVERRR